MLSITSWIFSKSNRVRGVEASELRLDDLRRLCSAHLYARAESRASSHAPFRRRPTKIDVHRRKRLQQIIKNLLSNAFKNSRISGRVTLTVEAVQGG